MDFISAKLGIHEKALGLRSQRVEVLSQNIANADTPHFKARDIDFKQVFSRVNEAQQMVATQAQHYEVSEEFQGDPLKYRVPFNTSFDGNTVEISVEQAKFGKAAADYQATLSFLQDNFSGIRRALKGE